MSKKFLWNFWDTENPMDFLVSYSFLTADREFSLVGETSGFSNFPEIFDFCDFILVSIAIMLSLVARKGDEI